MLKPYERRQDANVLARICGPLARCAAGQISPHVALAQLLCAIDDRDELHHVIDYGVAHIAVSSHEARARLDQLRATADQFAFRLPLLRAVLRRVKDPGEGDPVQHWAQLFDTIASLSPEASVALYSLGDPVILDEATREVAAALRDWRLLGRSRTALDIGCGIGRFESALAPELGFVVGLDVSSEMLAHARSRCAGCANAAFLRCDGRNLAMITTGSTDLVLAIDSFPYVTACGDAATRVLLSEIGRVLRPGGDLLIANFSYGGDVVRDRAVLREWSGEAGLIETRFLPRPFRSWDGVVFHLSRPG